MQPYLHTDFDPSHAERSVTGSLINAILQFGVASERDDGLLALELLPERAHGSVDAAGITLLWDPEEDQLAGVIDNRALLPPRAAQPAGSYAAARLKRSIPLDDRQAIYQHAA